MPAANTMDPLSFEAALSNRHAALDAFIERYWDEVDAEDPARGQAALDRHRELSRLRKNTIGWIAFCESEIVAREQTDSYIKHACLTGGQLGPYSWDVAPGGAADIRAANAGKAYFSDAMRMSTFQQLMHRKECRGRLLAMKGALDDSLARMQLLMRCTE